MSIRVEAINLIIGCPVTALLREFNSTAYKDVLQRFADRYHGLSFATSTPFRPTKRFDFLNDNNATDPTGTLMKHERSSP